MKMKLNFLFIAVTLLFSCKSSENQPEPMGGIKFDVLENNVTLNNSFKIRLLESGNATLNFRIIKLSTGHATSVIPSSTVQLLDNSTVGYPDALQENDSIKVESLWSGGNEDFVLGTSIGHAGKFEGNGPSYLGFRIIDSENFKYGWVLLDNNVGNTDLQIQSYAVNRTLDISLLAGQIE